MTNEIKFAIRAAQRSISVMRIGAAARRKDGKIVASHNATDLRPVPMGHAEVRLAAKLDVGAQVVVIRLRKDGSLAMAKPCRNCERRLRSSGVSKIWFSNEKGEIECLVR